MAYKSVTLVIFDGLGVAPVTDGNAVAHAKMSNFQNYIKNYPVMTVYSSGNEVGLSFGEMGNSEVGHLNIGAGRVYYQSCPRINNEISNGEFFKNPAFAGAVEHIKKNNSKLHLIGLLGTGNVHASDSHLYALLDFCAKNKLSDKVFVHGILDGRDALYNSGKNFVQDLVEKMKVSKVGELASLSGRFFAMDRDNRWDRCEKAYKTIALGKAERSGDDVFKIIDESYAIKNYDEEFTPTVITKNGQPVTLVQPGDAIIFFNFRPDRARELTKAFVLPGFNKFEREYIKDLYFVTMTEFEKDLPVIVAYPPIVVHNSLAETISKAKKKQFHVAETEKYAHITFFLNGTVEEPFSGEDRLIVPSPKVSSYAQVPEMSAATVAKEAVKAIDSGKYDFVVLNFANPDMVGHTGDLPATIKGCEAADKALGEVVEHTLAQGGVVVVTADHGNAEEVVNLQTGEIDKEHSTNPVPFLIIGKDLQGQAGPAGDPPEGDLSLMHPVGVLADVAPTVLKLMNIEQPPEMTGTPLI
jgi:2,3-bisphosphoglycerate-independent phosphoglycerate mutase